VRFRTLDAGQDPETAQVRFMDRLRGEVSFLARELGDPVMVRRDGRATYNFAVVVDDAAMKIDLVLRGDDHLSNTPRQVLFFKALGASLPDFAHLPMVRGTDGERLSKRHGATSVSEYRERGYLPAGVLNALVLLGWGPQGDESNILTPAEMIKRFDLARLSRSPSIFDPVKLGRLTATHIQNMPEDELGLASSKVLIAGQLLPETVLESSCETWRGGLARLVRDGIERFGQVPERAAALFHGGGAQQSPGDEIQAAMSEESFPPVLQAMLKQLDDGAPASVEEWKDFRKGVQSLSGVKGKGLFHGIRIAFTGDIHGPELDRLIPLIASGSQLFPNSIPSMVSRVRLSLEQLGD
jgi:nondiscriminating glutamyl-tRNA synthetase